MTLTISRTWVPSDDEWDRAWNACPYATYFHGREWAAIWEEFTRGKLRAQPLALAFSDGTEAILPFCRETRLRGLAHRYLSSPAGTFGGWLAGHSLDREHQQLLLQFILERYRDLLWRLNPYEKVRFDCPSLLLKQDETHTLDLTPGFQAIYRLWAHGQAAAARKARKAFKAGIRAAVADTPDDWCQYYDIYRASLARWGRQATTAYGRGLFETMQQRRSDNIRLWLARHNEEIVAGALCLYSPSHAIYWHGAALSSHFALRPVNLLMQEAIRDAATRGLRWFDFNPSGGLQGVKAFKRSFGATPLPCDLLATQTWPNRLASQACYLARALRFR